MIKRTAVATVSQLSKHFPVLLLSGPRQSGKTTLAKSLFAKLPYVLLESPDQRRAAQDDPRTFLSNFPAGAILDEVQNVPELFSYLQGIVDEVKGVLFVLTGSQNFLINEKISQSLAGRAGVATLLPFSLKELKKEIKNKSFEDWIICGFYPASYDRKIPHGLYYPSYVQTYLERDVRNLQNVGNLMQFNTFIKLCAGRTGQVLNMSALSAEAGVSVNTVKSWISILEISYILFRLPPYHKNFKKRVVKSPKLYFIDTGLASYLLGIKTAKQLSTHYALGALFENFVIMEIYKQRINTGDRNGLYYWRDNKGVEIDLLIETNQGPAAIEIKAGRTANIDYFKNLTYWNKLTGIQNSYVIYGGDQTETTRNGRLMSWKELSSQVF